MLTLYSGQRILDIISVHLQALETVLVAKKTWMLQSVTMSPGWMYRFLTKSLVDGKPDRKLVVIVSE